jgi:hypothetical protein
MSTSEEVRLRQIIWAEYRSGSSEKQAHTNIIAKLGPKSVCIEKIKLWYGCFQHGDGNICLFSRNDIEYAIQTLSNGDDVYFKGG